MVNKGKIIKEGTPKEIKKDTKTTNLRDAFFTLIGGECFRIIIHDIFRFFFGDI